MKKPAQYRVTRLFIGGLLEGLTHTAITASPPPEGFICRKPVGGSPYRVVAIERLVEAA